MENNSSTNTTLTVFLALWDEDLGPVIESEYPEPAIFDNLDGMASNLFMTFQTIFGEAADVSFKKMNLTIPFKSENCIARIQLDVIPNDEVRAGLQPFLVVALIPGEMLEESLKTFDPYLEKVADEFKKEKEVSLDTHIGNFQKNYNIAQQFEELEINLETAYDIKAAVEDFKIGIDYFQKKQFKAAYSVIKKAFVKFDQEKQDNFAMEASYMLGTLLVQLKKYQPAIKHFNNLAILAESKNVPKYQELFRFMLGLCNYKLNNYQKVSEYLEEIDINNSKFVNKLQYYSILAHTYYKLKKYNDAITLMKKKMDLLSQIPASSNKDRLIAQGKYELGLAYYNYAIKNLKEKSSESILEAKLLAKPLLEKSIDYFRESIQIWETLSNNTQIIVTLENISNIYNMLELPFKELEILNEAIIKARSIKNKDLETQFLRKIDNLKDKVDIHKYPIVKNQIENNDKIDVDTEEKRSIVEKQTITDMTNDILEPKDTEEDIENDYLRIVSDHIKLGNELIESNNLKAASIEFINAINIMKRLKKHNKNELIALEKLVFIYTELDENDKKQYYQYQIEDFKQQSPE